MEQSELDRIDPEGSRLKLSFGEVVVVRLGTRQFFRLLRVLTHGARGGILAGALDFSGNAEEFGTRLMTMLVLSLPDAEQEAIDFLNSIVEPVGIRKGSKLNKADREHNDRLWTELQRDLFNPDPLDTLTIIEAVIAQEQEDLSALGNRLGQLMKLAQRTGQLEDRKPEIPPEPRTLAQQESSRQLSTSSPASTDGATSESSTSRSAGSGRSRTRSPAAAGSQRTSSDS
jgi:hypothetical protein